jgi:hypothetical protein
LRKIQHGEFLRMSNGDGIFAPQEAPFARIFDIGVGADAQSDAFPSANRLKLLPDFHRRVC